MDKPAKFQIPHATPVPIARALRRFELGLSKMVGGLNDSAEILEFYSAGKAWFVENQKAMVLPGVQRAGTDRCGNEPLQFEIPHETPVRVAAALRTLEREVAETLTGVSNPVERMGFYAVGQLWFDEAIVLAGKDTGRAAGAGAPEPHAA